MTPRYAGPVTSVAARSRVRRRNSGTRRPAAVAGGTFTINPSAQSGYISSGGIVSYADARSGSATVTAAPGGGPIVGQQYAHDDELGTDFISVWESFLDFDVSGVTGTISSATLSLGLTSDTSTTDFTVQARLRDWGATLTTADFVAGGSLGALTLLATLATSGIGSTGAYKAMTESGSALRTAVGLGGTLRMLLCSDRTVSNTDPSASGDGNEFVQFSAYNDASFKPKLVVVTS